MMWQLGYNRARKQGVTWHMGAYSHLIIFTVCASHEHTQCSTQPLGENKHLIKKKKLRCASVEVDYMYLAQIIISGSHVHSNYS